MLSSILSQVVLCVLVAPQHIMCIYYDLQMHHSSPVPLVPSPRPPRASGQLARAWPLDRRRLLAPSAGDALSARDAGHVHPAVVDPVELRDNVGERHGLARALPAGAAMRCSYGAFGVFGTTFAGALMENANPFRDSGAENSKRVVCGANHTCRPTKAAAIARFSAADIPRHFVSPASFLASATPCRALRRASVFAAGLPVPPR